METINSSADTPDLAVILTADPAVAAHRIGQRGAHSRFEAGITTSRTEAELYRDATTRLAERGYPLLIINTSKVPTVQLNGLIAARIVQLAGLSHSDSDTA